MSKKLFLMGFIILSLSVFISQQTTNAEIKEYQLDEFAQNDISFYDPSDCESRNGVNGNVSVCSASLIDEAISQLELAQVKEKAQENLERYQYAEKETGLPWQVVATLHFLEGGMGSNVSISNGEALYDHVNVDGIHVSADANEDAKQAAEHFIGMVKSVYGIDILTDTSIDAYGKAFLAYNRGAMYQCNGDVSYTESPYVMNFYDENHKNMAFVHADSYLCDGSQINDVEGSTWSHVGALATLAYLCGGDSSSSSSNSSSSSSNSSSTSSSSSSSSSDSSSSSSSNSGSSSAISGDDITWIGDSYSVGAQPIIESTFPGISFGGSSNDSSSYIQACKNVSMSADGICGFNRNPSGFEILQKIIDSKELKPYLVFALGTNNEWSEDDITDFQNMIKDQDVKVVVVSSKIPNRDYAASNERLKKMADSNDNIYLADWTAVYKEEYFDSDPEKIHPYTEPGFEKWVGAISDALSGVNGGCTTYEGEYPQYNQCGDSRWSNYPYSTDDICGSGCGVASMAMLATVATGQDIFPDDIAKLLGNQYYDSVSIATLDPIVGEHYGFEVETVSVSGIEDTKTKLRDYLKRGYMVHFTGKGCYPGFIYASGGCTPGHVIGLFDIDNNDMVTQANSGMGEVHQKASLDDMANALNFGIFTAIKGGNNSKNQCSNLCNAKNTSVAGLTETQAQKLADYYNGPDVDANEYGLPYGKTNCVSFSMWFTKAIADLSWVDGNGRDVAHALAEAHGLSEGTEPRPYAVFSVTRGSTMCGDALCGHTGIVVAVNGDEVLTVEAAYPSTLAYVTTRDLSYFENTVYKNTFTYLDSSIDQSKLKNIVGN